jgi:hypothetical protein
VSKPTSSAFYHSGGFIPRPPATVPVGAPAVTTYARDADGAKVTCDVFGCGRRLQEKDHGGIFCTADGDAAHTARDRRAPRCPAGGRCGSDEHGECPSCGRPAPGSNRRHEED